ncbi:MAG TPA: alpha-2-macroglobulin family protein, partial [Phycisphaerae bacterium]|nr:alpha-2-macroglobulin family protein [Phycisphaerae bacterium]
VRSPFPGRLLLTVETDTVLLTKVVEMTTTVAEVPLDLPAGIFPNAYLAATVVRPIDPTKEWRTHRAFGIARFDTDPADQRLAIRITAPTELRPSKMLDLDLAVLDAKGQPAANAAIALAAVDEGILRLTSYQTPKPLNYFAATRALGIETADVYARLMPEVLPESLVGGDSGGPDGFARRRTSPVSGKRVKPVSLVNEILHTDSAGHAQAHLQLPEFLGQLRIMAIAYSGNAMGSQDKTLLVRSPLVVQSSFPRFLAPGDRCDVPLLVINNSTQAGTATLQLTTDGPLSLADARREIKLAAGDQQIVSMDLSASQAIGIGHLTLTATLNDETYTEHLELPVRPASPEITRGGSLTATPEKHLTLAVPAAMLKGTESFDLRITQKPSFNLPEGLAYLDHYPYGCLEQTTSTCFPLVYLPDIGKTIAPGVFEEDRVSRKIQTGITRLIGMQTASGGLAMWPGSTDDWMWGSVYAAHFLTEAQQAGYPGPADFKTRLTTYLHTLLQRTTDGPEMAEVQAYALYVLALANTPDRPMMNHLGEILAEDAKRPGNGGGMDQARLHLALAWTAAGRKDFAEKLLPDQLPAPRTTRQLAGNVGSPVRDQALLILTLLAANPDHPAIPSLIEKLSSAATSGGWRSTQDNAFAVMALGKYLRATKNDQPYDRAQLLQGEQQLAQAQGASPLLWSGDSQTPLTIRITGNAAAKAYVSFLQTGIPLEIPPDADHSLKIRRQYHIEAPTLGVPPSGGRGNATPPVPPQPMTLATGTSVRVQFTIESPTPLNNVVIEDLLPAGLEAENPRLQTAKRDEGTSTTQAATQPRPLPVDRMDVRDDRIIMITYVPAGTSTFSYLARAVTPGNYTVPPVRAECMYDPAINSINGGGAKIVVTPK